MCSLGLLIVPLSSHCFVEASQQLSLHPGACTCHPGDKKWLLELFLRGWWTLCNASVPAQSHQGEGIGQRAAGGWRDALEMRISRQKTTWEMDSFWGVQEQGTGLGGTGDAEHEAPSCLAGLHKARTAVPCLRCCGLSQWTSASKELCSRGRTGKEMHLLSRSGKCWGREPHTVERCYREGRRAMAVDGASPRAAGWVFRSNSPWCRQGKDSRLHPHAALEQGPHPAVRQRLVGLSPRPAAPLHGGEGTQPSSACSRRATWDFAGCCVDTPVHSNSEPCWEDCWTGKTELEASVFLVILPGGAGHPGFSALPTFLLADIYLFTAAGRNVTATADCFRCFNICLYWHSPAALCTSITLSIRITRTNKAALLPPSLLCGLGRPSKYLFRHTGSKLSTTQNESPHFPLGLSMAL